MSLEFADNAQLRFGETTQIQLGSSDGKSIYFIVHNMEDLTVCSFNSDIIGLNNLHHGLSSFEEWSSLLVLCVWKGVYQAHTFVCNVEELLPMIRGHLGSNFCDELGMS